MIINNLLAFTIVTLFFFPAINKVVRLANRAWNEREFLEEAPQVEANVIHRAWFYIYSVYFLLLFGFNIAWIDRDLENFIIFNL